jgi:hypothetical protein
MRDDQLTRLLRTLEEPATPDGAFADRLFDNLTQVAGRPRRSSVGLLLVAALVLVAMLSVGVAVGSGLLKVPWLAVTVSPAPSEVSPSPSGPITSLVESPSEGPTPSVIALPVVSVPGGILPPGSQAIVAVDGLRIRSDPSTTATVRSTLALGATVLVVHSIEEPMPVIAEGTSWYMVQPVPGDITMSGWVSAGEGGTTYLTLSSPSTCQDLLAATVTLTQLIEAGSWHRLACLGNAQITITGVIDYRCQGGSRAGSTYEPAWLVDWCPTQTLTPAESVTQEIHDTLDMVAPPGGPAIQPRGTIVRVTGHFADASSAECVIENAYGYQPDWTVWEGAETLLCQEQFVITELEKTGFMELPPLG